MLNNTYFKRLSLRLGAALMSLSVALSAALLPGGLRAVAEEAPEARPLVYTALGDSISTGYRLSDVSNAYVNLFGGYLNTTPANMGQNGLDSAGLLKKLTDDQNVINQVKKSDIITISMGGNDMLPIFSSLSPTSLSTLMTAVQKLQGNSMQKAFKTAVDKFSANWQKIIARVKELAPNATVIVTTLINPYQGIVVSIPLVLNFDLGAYGDTYIKQINAVITKDASGNYQVADSYTLFKKNSGKKLTNADLGSFDFDPHPNVTGHHLIADAHEALKLHFTHDALSLQGPSTLVIPIEGKAMGAQYTAQPLLTCFTKTGVTPAVAYSVTDAGRTGAVINAETGELSVKAPGKVTLKAVMTLPQSNLSAETTQTVQVTRASKTVSLTGYLLPGLAGLAFIAAVTLVIGLRHRTKRRHAHR